MRSNIDLTSNQMFSGNPDRVAVIRSVANEPFRWRSDIRFVMHDAETISELERNEVVKTGNRELREEKREWRNIDSGDSCDCCGASLIRKPWSRHYGLCASCAKELDEYPFDRQSKMPRHLRSKDLMMIPDRRKNPFRRFGNNAENLLT